MKYQLLTQSRITGVSPAARIRVYKVAQCGANLRIDVLIAAHIKAYKDGADIISTSIGDLANWPIHVWTKASNKIAQKGVFVISSAGNSGFEGPFLSSSQAAGEVSGQTPACEPSNLTTSDRKSSQLLPPMHNSFLLSRQLSPALKV